MPKMQPEVPAVVVGGTLNSLGVVRSLSQGRMPIYVLETTRRCAAGWSRYCHFVHTPSLEGHGLIESLIDLATQLECRPVLILTSDQSVNTVSADRDRIAPLYRISLPTVEMVSALADKTLFQALAEREKFAVPRAVALADPADLTQLQNLIPPLIVKPADKTLVLKGIAERAVRADTLLEARVLSARMLACAPRIIVQEWIDGPDTEIFFVLFSCDRHGGVIGLFPGRKLACSPPAVGSTAICVAAPEVADELYAQTLQFISRVAYRGLGSLEFKRDSRTGRFLIVEPTVGRTDWQEEIATLCGVNLPLSTYRAELEQAMPANTGSFKRVSWRSTLEYRAPAGELGAGTRVVDGFFRWSDPLPAIYYYGYERFVLPLWRRGGRLLS
jgi:D-aspartate ligase